MNKGKFILLARKRLWRENGTTETALHNNSINELIEYIQSEPEETCKYCKETPCWLCETAGECRTAKHCKENNNADYKPRQNYCHVCGRDLNKKNVEPKEKTKFDVMMESPEKLAEFIIEVQNDTKNGYVWKTGERCIDYLNRKAGE